MFVQLGLFGECSGTIAATHVVSAHTRILSDGTEVHVAEHLRWNRGQQAVPRMPRPAPRPPACAAQIQLFPPEPAPRTSPVMEPEEVLPGAWQLPLWSE